MLTCFKHIIASKFIAAHTIQQCNAMCPFLWKMYWRKVWNNFSAEIKLFKEWEMRNIFDIRGNTSQWDCETRGGEGETQVVTMWHPDQREFHVQVSMIKQLNSNILHTLEVLLVLDFSSYFLFWIWLVRVLWLQIQVESKPFSWRMGTWAHQNESLWAWFHSFGKWIRAPEGHCSGFLQYKTEFTIHNHPGTFYCRYFGWKNEMQINLVLSGNFS